MIHRLRGVDEFKRNPIAVQNSQLQYLLRNGRKTKFGKEFFFDKIDHYSAFSKHVPVASYSDIQPWILRAVKGESDVLWPGILKWVAKSSGTTTGRSKFIPVTAVAMQECHYRAGRDMLGHICRNNPQTQIFTGKGIILGGSHEVSEWSENIRTGDLSGILVQNLSSLARFLSSIDLDVALLADWDEKLDALAKQYLSKKVTNISGVTSWMLILFQYLLEREGKKSVLDIWPDFEVCIHGGVSFQPYRTQFQKIFPGDQVKFYESFNASEGFFAMQDRNDADDILLMLDYGIFYEFCPFENQGEDQDQSKNLVPLEGVEIGKKYILTISTSSGLWRYQPGDLVQFTSTNPYRVKVVGRTAHFINAFGEELIVENADRAIGKVAQKENAPVKDYTAAPVFMKDGAAGRHEWYIEFENPPENLERFMDELDLELQRLNSDYEAKRKGDLLLESPRLKIVRNGLFTSWLRSKGKLGGQNKIPRLQNDRKFMDELDALGL